MASVRYRLLALLATTLSLISACTQVVEPGSLTPVMPLAVGNRWIYRVDGGALDTFEIVSTRRIGFETWYVANDSGLYINRVDGLWATPARSFTRHVALGAPRLGDTVEHGRALVLLPGPKEMREVAIPKTVTAIDTIITVSGGSFRSTEYLLDEGFRPERLVLECFAPNVGLVYAESGTIMRPAVERELIAFHLVE